MTTGLLTTLFGQQALLADAAGTAELAITAIAIGDANGAPYAPNVNQAALVNERYRMDIAAVSVVPGMLLFDCTIPADGLDAQNRPSNGFRLAEAALFGTSGGIPGMLGVAQMGNGFLAPPTGGQANVVSLRLALACANPSTIAVTINPAAQIMIGRHVRAGWITVDGVVNDPPANPQAGATYIIGPAPTGAWAGFQHRLAQWVGVWSLASVPEGHIVDDRSKAIDHIERFLVRTAAGWGSAAATEGQYGVTRLATAAEALAGSSSSAALTPATFNVARLQRRRQTFTGVGAVSWVVPPDVTKILVRVQGGGGGGKGAMIDSTLYTPGGGGGAYAEKLMTVVPGETIAGFVGAAGLGGGPGADGLPGGSTAFGPIVAMGGGGGIGAAPWTSHVATAEGGDLNEIGYSQDTGIALPGFSVGGYGADSRYGQGGAGGVDGAGGYTARGFGAGGGGASSGETANLPGAAGSSGIIEIDY